VGTLAQGDAPAVAGSTWLAVAAAVGRCHGRADAAKRRCGAFLGQTNEKLSAAADSYAGTDAGGGDALEKQVPR
jgi:phosphate starvation-inducible protein PhoH